MLATCAVRVDNCWGTTSSCCAPLRFSPFARLSDLVDDVNDLTVAIRSKGDPTSKAIEMAYAVFNIGSDGLDLANLVCDALKRPKLADRLDYYGSVFWICAVVVELYHTLTSARPSSFSKSEHSLRVFLFALSLGRNICDGFSSLSAVVDRLASFQTLVDASYFLSGCCGLGCTYVEFSL